MRKSDSKIKKEELSQLIDGEWFELDAAKRVASLCADKSLHSKWARYHLVKDIVKGEPVQPNRLLAERICAAIEDEQTYTNVTELNHVRSSSAGVATGVAAVQSGNETVPRARHAWLGTGLAGSALAASVALATVLGVKYVGQQPEVIGSQPTIASADTQQEAAPVEAVLPEVEFVSNTGSYWVSEGSAARAEGEEQLNMMLSHHLESSPTANREGLLSYSRLVGYDETLSGH